MWSYPLQHAVMLPDELGTFGALRKNHTHEGVDLYANKGDSVFAVEDGVVVGLEWFTGEKCVDPSPWWNNTQAILIEGKSGVVLYGELLALPHIKVGERITRGECIGDLETVLKKDKGRPMTMLHLELYKHGTTKSETWEHHQTRPLNLLDPTVLLERAFYNEYDGEIRHARFDTNNIS